MSTNPSPSTRRPLHHHVLRVVSPPLAHIHHRRYHGHPWHLAADTILHMGMVAVSVAALFLLVFRTGSGVPKLTVAPLELVSGQAAELRLTLEAPRDTELQRPVVLVDLPPGWTSQSPVLVLARATAGERYETVWHIVPVGQPDERIPVLMVIRWEANGEVFTTRQTVTLRLTDSAFGLTVTAPAEVSSGQTWTMTTTVDTQALPNTNQAQADVILPVGVEVVGADPALADGHWDLNVAAAKAQIFTLQLRLTVRRTTTLRVGAKVVVTSAGQSWTQVTRTADVVVRSTSGGDLVTTPATARPTFASEVRYHSVSGQQFGYGPWPPTVGQETVYRVFWYIRPSQRTVAGGLVTMTLPSGVRWVGHQSLSGGQSVSYDAGRRQVRWTIGDVQTGRPTMVASFDIGLTPVASQRGQTVRITNQSLFSWVGGQMTAAGLTTGDVDGGAGRNGLVR